MTSNEIVFEMIVPAAAAPRVALVLRCGPKGRNH
jgi:hypothetical protein